MTDQNNPNDPLIKPQKAGLFASLRTSFLAGIVVAAPILITIGVLYWFITGPMARLDGFVQNWIPDQVLPDGWADYIPGLGFVLAVIMLIILGAMAKNFIGRSVINFGERILDSMPIVRNLYGFFKNVFDMALQQSERSFKEVGLIEYPKKGIWALAFVVTSAKGEVRHKLTNDKDGPFDDEEIESVFIPTTPNPTSGFLLFLPRKDIKILDMTVEEGAKLIFSAGLVNPDFTNPDDLKTIAIEQPNNGK